MAMNPDYVGRVYPPAGSYVVGREKIREFAAALGDESPVYHDPSAAREFGYHDVVAPPTFAFVLSMRASAQVIEDPDLGLDYSRVVHGEQRFAYDRPIVAGDELRVRTTIDSIRSMAGNDLVMTRADIETTAGEHVATTHSLLVARAADDGSAS